MSARDPIEEQRRQLESWLGSESYDALRAVVPSVMPAQSLALYARWWQLEAWLRELIYVELRALYGAKWLDKLRAASGRQTQDAAYKHMSTADSENPLAYLDYSQLLEVIENHWGQFEYALLESGSWTGRQEELKRVRHRIGHIRKPHRDDLARIEQTLRDLEQGAFIACAAYNKRILPSPKKFKDAMTAGWISGEHPTAQRLIRHADIQYGVGLEVRVSRRPWASWPEDLENAEGLFWHADFYSRDRAVDVHHLWNEIRGIRPLIVHMLVSHPHHVEFTFSSIDDSVGTADVLGACFDALLYSLRHGSRAQQGAGLDDQGFAEWRSRTESIDYRIMSSSGWSIVSEDTIPISMFGAGGHVELLPEW
ncbi:Swt1 family HEPN domain-containing protein [Streptomyces sp. NPDC056159]|uniref:Swt1 family HEPN domain-containing protein n=1 Tax=Streptomyces sp. NPDC056159 TaxID=3155537 RepID=UPI0034362601